MYQELKKQVFFHRVISIEQKNYKKKKKEVNLQVVFYMHNLSPETNNKCLCYRKKKWNFSGIN